MNSTDWDYDLVIAEASQATFPDVSVAELAGKLASSGDQLILGVGVRTADIPSTGGPSSLSTLLCPLILNASGFTVPKLGVPGRPAGGLDVLAQIPGYNVGLSSSELQRVLDHCGYAHFAAGRFAPADAKMFARRQALGAQQVPALVIASILSKKVALSVSRVCLDVRTGPSGNFGTNELAASENARRFCRVAEIMGISATCYVSDARTPYQAYIGRGEQLLAMARVLDGSSDDWLNAHVAECEEMADAISAGSPIVRDKSIWKQRFALNLEAQGSSWTNFEAACDRLRNAPTFTIEAATSGFPDYDIGLIRAVIVDCQNANADAHAFPDPVGITLLAPPATPVALGAPVARVRLSEGCSPTELRQRLLPAFRQTAAFERRRGFLIRE